MKRVLVTTTINVPRLLAQYCADFYLHGYGDTEIIIVGDKKTPPETDVFTKALRSNYPGDITYMDPEMQTAYLDKHAPEYGEFLPWNCIQRRNVGILKAYAEGADIIYTIDDDNFLHTKNYIGQHGNLGTLLDTLIISSSTGWYNVCSRLMEAEGKDFYHRGYSFKARSQIGTNSSSNSTVKTVVNAGLWLGDPDIDAVTRFAIDPIVTSDIQSRQFALGLGTKSPFNSQNTALHRSVIPAYCLGAGLGRYDDIVASYFVKRIADHLGDYISYGLPLVKQERNKHDLWKDLADERLGMQLIDKIVEWLYNIELTGTNYKECTKEILSKFVDLYEIDTTLNQEQGAFLDCIVQNYLMWGNALSKLS